MKDSEGLIIVFETVLNGLLTFGQGLVGHVATIVGQVAK
jgi:hypothetical protein